MLRAATAADASRLAEIYIFAKRMAYRPIFNDDKVSFNEMQVLPLALDLRDREEARKGLFVWDDGIVRGLARRSWLPGEEKTFFFEELYIDPCFQGQGYGSKLMNGFLEAARAEGGRGGLPVGAGEEHPGPGDVQKVRLCPRRLPGPGGGHAGVQGGLSPQAVKRTWIKSSGTAFCGAAVL